MGAWRVGFRSGSGSHLRRALGSSAGTWSSSQFESLGSANFWPDATVSGVATYVTWNRDGRTVEADDTNGGFASRTFLTSAQNRPPQIAVSSGSVAVGWSTLPGRAFVAKRVGSTWSGAYASPSSATRIQVVVGVTFKAGKVTALIASGGFRLYAATES